jgi:hypothetical protein
MDRFDVSHDRVKVGAAWLAERAGRLKLNGRLLGRSPLSRLIELEGLHLGVTGKADLWKTLETTVAGRLEGVDLAELIRRAERQAAELQEHRLRAAEHAFDGEDY